MPDQPPVDEQNEIRKRAVRRLIAAFVVVALAIAALTILTKYQPEKPVARTAPQEQETVLPPEPPVPAAPPETPPPAPEAEAKPETPPPPPEVVNAPPATPAPAAEKPAKPAGGVSATPPPARPQPAAKPEPASGLRLDHKLAAPQTAPSRPTAQPPAQAARPSEAPRIAERAPAPPPARPVEAVPPKAYTVQLGVFSNPANALQLQEKLAQHGIKSYTETKLNIGPFQNKAEADAALAKLRSLGISAVVVPGR